MMEEMAVIKPVHVMETVNEMLEEINVSKPVDSTDMERVPGEECIGTVIISEGPVEVYEKMDNELAEVVQHIGTIDPNNFVTPVENMADSVIQNHTLEDIRTQLFAPEVPAEVDEVSAGTGESIIDNIDSFQNGSGWSWVVNKDDIETWWLKFNEYFTGCGFSATTTPIGNGRKFSLVSGKSKFTI